MAVVVKEKEMKLQSYFVDESSGKQKKRIVTISNINPEASMDNLLTLSQDLDSLVEGEFMASKRVTGESLGYQE